MMIPKPEVIEEIRAWFKDKEIFSYQVRRRVNKLFVAIDAQEALIREMWKVIRFLEDKPISLQPGEVGYARKAINKKRNYTERSGQLTAPLSEPSIGDRMH